METYAPERQQELAQQAHEPRNEVPDDGRYTDTTTDNDPFEVEVDGDTVQVYNIYGGVLRTESVGSFVMRVQMGTYKAV